MKFIHVLSTEGWRAATKSPAFDMDDPEVMTMMLSALQARKFGAIKLYTDPHGREFVERRKFAHLYDRISMLPHLPRINHQVFWDIYKQVALDMSGYTGTVIDTDLVLFKGISEHCTRFGHLEPVDMEPYPTNREHFEKFGFSYGWDWTAPAVNTCLINFNADALASTWVQFGLGFAEVYSHHLEQHGGNLGWQFEPALFASQRLLGMLLSRWKIWPSSGYLFNLGEAPHHDYTPAAFHLWGRKEIYRTCVEPRAQMLNWLRDRIVDHGADGRKMLDNAGLYQTFTEQTQRFQISCRGRVAIEPDMNDTLLTRTVITTGKHWRAMDPCSGLSRVLRFGEVDKLYRGDVLFSDTAGGQCSVWWNKRKLAELVSPVEPGKADWIWNLPVRGSEIVEKEETTA